jgi:hypothetical protein
VQADIGWFGRDRRDWNLRSNAKAPRLGIRIILLSKLAKFLPNHGNDKKDIVIGVSEFKR